MQNHMSIANKYGLNLQIFVRHCSGHLKNVRSSMEQIIIIEQSFHKGFDPQRSYSSIAYYISDFYQRSLIVNK